ncbi:MAG: zinc-ribbon domain-containing protein [Deltaproteobacteria bacterium]|nr:zinc-ribbon domain-containing protein [Deltaproteobacteria bacterium]
MKVVCQTCQARCLIDGKLLPPTGGHLRCPRCRTVFFYDPTARQVTADQPPAPLASEPDTSSGRPKQPTVPDIREKRQISALNMAVKRPRQRKEAAFSDFIRRRSLMLVMLIAVAMEFMLVGIWAAGRLPEIKTEPTALAPACLSKQMEQSILASIKTHETVGDASLTQEGHRTVLAVLVDHNTPAATALGLKNQCLNLMKKQSGLPLDHQFKVYIYCPNGMEITRQPALNTTVTNR